jgi:hydrogenase maturation protease
MGFSRARPRILIAGLGNSLLTDDGIGVHIVRELRKDFSPGTLAVEVGTAVLDALHLIEWADKILAVDAMQAGGLPGTVYASDIHDMEESASRASLHELSLLAALRFLPDQRRPEVVVLGIEPEKIDYGLDLSSTLLALMPRYLQVVNTLTAGWKRNFNLQNRKEALEALVHPSHI